MYIKARIITKFQFIYIYISFNQMLILNIIFTRKKRIREFALPFNRFNRKRAKNSDYDTLNFETIEHFNKSNIVT